MVVTTSFAATPWTTSVAEAGPVAASSEGAAPGMLGKLAGRLSQIRPQSVSVWPLAAAEPPAGEAGPEVVAGGRRVGGEPRACVADPLDGPQATMVSATTATSVGA